MLIFSNAQAADDEQAAFDAVAGSAKAQIQARDNSREAIAEAVQAQTEKVYAACEDYLKRFPAGAHVDQVRLLDLDARVMLGTQMEKHRDLLDGVPALAEAAMKTSPTVDRKLRVHHALWRYNNAKADGRAHV